MRTRKIAQVHGIEKLWMSNAEAQAYLGVGPDFFRYLRERKALNFSKIGKTIFYLVSDIDELVAANLIDKNAKYKVKRDNNR